MQTNIDYKSLARTALDSIQAILRHLAPNGRRSGCEYITLNPTRKDSQLGSFSVNMRTGEWSDFATGDRGTDVINLWAYIKRVEQGEAAKQLAAFLSLPIITCNTVTSETASRNAFERSVSEHSIPGNKSVASYSGKACKAVPLNAPPPPDRHRQLGEPVKIYPYTDKDGGIIFYQYRFETATGKEFRPLSFCSESGKWRWQGIDSLRPLYRLAELTAKPGAPVVVAEGEKSAEAAQMLFPEYVATTWASGAKSSSKSDWGPLQDRDVILWSDFDKSGEDAMQEISIRLKQLGVKSLRTVNSKIFLQGIKVEDQAGFDAADALENGWTSNEVQDLIDANELFLEAATTETEPPSPAHTNSSYKKFGPFTLNQKGVWFEEPPKSDGDAPTVTWVCSPLEISAQVRDEQSGSWGRLLEFDDPAGIHHKWCLPMELLAGSGDEYRRVLLSLGLRIAVSAKGKSLLATYLQTATPERKVLCTNRTGWHSGAFVLPDATLGDQDGEQLIYQSTAPAQTNMQEKGHLAEWTREVSALCSGNSLLVFAVSLAFAAPMLYLAGDENGGIHLRGSSSSGKTTALLASASVFGGKHYMRTWRATANGLEATFSALSDLPLIIDEMSQASPEEVGETVYMAGNGTGKNRADRNGGSRATARWRTLFLSAGEIGLSAHMSKVRKKSTAGQEVRAVDVPADGQSGLGLFEDLHGHQDGDHFARHLKSACNNYHGTAGIAWLQILVSNAEVIRQECATLKASFLNEFDLSNEHGSQAKRIASRFALIAAAGELASQYGITSWPSGEAKSAAQRALSLWRENRGGTGDLEKQRLIDQVRLFIEQNGDSRFPKCDDTQQKDPERTVNRAGYRKPIKGAMHFLVLQEVFKQEVCNTFEHAFATKTLKEAGILTPDSSGVSTQNQRVPGTGQQMRVYCLNSDKLFE